VDVRSLRDFYQALGDAQDDRWSEDGLRNVADRMAPHGMLGRNEWLLRADYALIVGRWFVEGLIDIAAFARGTGNVGHLLNEFRTVLRQQVPDAEQQEIDQTARRLAVFAIRRVNALRGAGRERIDWGLRRDVWFRSEPVQRCYLCGFRFGPTARDLYLRRSATLPTTHQMVDFTRPRGTNPRHLRAEVDHIIPVAEGGTTTLENLAIVCGWCNIVKSRWWNVYDVNAWQSGVMYHPSLALQVTVPQPFWVLRVVATRGRCEAPAGCGARLEDHELFIAPRSAKGALTPTNLMVVCNQHDPWAGHRLVSPALLPSTSSRKR